MDKLLYITPHLSTGGLPQFLLKKVQLLKNRYEIHLIEYSNISNHFITQKTELRKILKNNLYTLGENKKEIFNIISYIQPNIIHFEEIPEYFCDKSIAFGIYHKNRNYKIFETSHDSSYNIDNKIFYPDMFLMVSNFQVKKFKKTNVPTKLIEYPIDKKEKNKEEALKKLKLDPNKIHIINVGLFTPRKNQKEIFEYAKLINNDKVQFHFIGNMADNFKYYWDPLLNDLPKNCIIHGERNDVELFYQAADLLLFTSRGQQGDKETMPLVLREALMFDLPIYMYNLDVYENYFDKYKNITYLNFNNTNENLLKIIKFINENS
jgi:glycosyltransferase involved in cell wall biosynthesis